MLKLMKYLKPYLPMVLLAVVLLFIQAMSDLALPKYMSEIVNNGIQQGGVVNPTPNAVRQSQMEKLVSVMIAEDRALTLRSYTLVDQNSADYDKYVAEYPVLANEPVYVLNKMDQAQIDRLNPVMAKALLIVSGLQKAASDPALAAEMGRAAGLDLSGLPQGTNLFAVIDQLPEAQRAQFQAAVNKQFDGMTESMLNQSAVGVVREEYAALGVNIETLQSSYIIRTGGLMLLISMLSVACAIIVGFLSARTGSGVARDLRKATFKKVEDFSGAELDHFSTASLITRSTNDITQIQMVIIMMIRMVIYAPIMGVGGIIRAFSTGASMWWLIAVAVGVLLTLVATVFTLAMPKFKIIQSLIDRLNLVTRENLSGMMVIRAFNMQNFEEKRFDKANRDLTSTNLFTNRVMVVMMPAMMLIMNGLSIMIIWIGAHQVAQSNMQVGDMMAFMQYAMQIVFSFLMLSFMFILIPRASVSAGRIAEVLETEPSIKDPQSPRHFSPSFKGSIEFRDVTFRYPGAEADVLSNISFVANPGETTAFIGSTGSGKSTIVNLIPRFYDITSGSILVDGTDIRAVTQHELREKIGYVPQKSSLFSGSIESNLRFADENASHDQLHEAVEVAQASEIIAEKDSGYESEISQGGTNVSGGQKQRLSIARALVKNAPIYIFDDSFSALDFRTDAALRRALKEKTASSTLLIVTQRISTVKNAEQIIVVDNGAVVGKGTHNQLMETCETYREIALSQLSLEELS